MKTVKPARLVPAGTIALIAPAGPLVTSDRDLAPLAARAKLRLERLGYKVVFGRHAFDSKGYLAGSDEARAQDVQEMMTRGDLSAVLCIRGGYGCARLLDLLDWKAIRRRRRILIGCSDVTALCLALYQKAGLVAFHGPLAAPDLGRSRPPIDYNLANMLDVLTGRAVEFRPPKRGRMARLSGGKAQGELVGGNLSVICGLLGTQYEVRCKDKILFLEDVNEQPYQVDRMLNQLQLAGKLREAAALAFGELGASREPLYLEIASEYSLRAGKPSLSGVPCGHGPHKATIPVGVLAYLDADEGKLGLLEPATS